MSLHCPEQYPSQIIPKFLTDGEIALVENLTALHGSNDIVGFAGNPHGHHAKICNFFLDRPQFKDLAEMLVPKIKRHFGEDLIIAPSTHILEAYSPYGIHNDVVTAGFVPNDLTDAAWTFIIPVADYDSHTVVFHQQHDYIKTPQEWIDQTGQEPHGALIDPSLHKDYLSHCSPDHLRYLTVEHMFPWKKGDLFAASRRKFHVSDNFPANGLSFKRGIVMWSELSK